MFYKHFLFHGLNASLVFRPASSLSVQETAPVLTMLPFSQTAYFALYWTGLNAAYTLEFFLQSLVKRKHMSQTVMLAFNQVLMIITTVAAVRLLCHVSMGLALFSLATNVLLRELLSKDLRTYINSANVVLLLAVAFLLV
jgi:hypothetical protein